MRSCEEQIRSRQEPLQVVFGATEQKLASEFQVALLRKQMAVDIVLTEKASKETVELQEWLNKYFCWPLRNE